MRIGTEGERTHTLPVSSQVGVAKLWDRLLFGVVSNPPVATSGPPVLI